MLKTTKFTLFDIELINKYGNLTEREEFIFNERNKENPMTMEQIAEVLEVSPRHAGRIVKSLKAKIIRVMEYHYKV